MSASNERFEHYKDGRHIATYIPRGRGDDALGGIIFIVFVIALVLTLVQFAVQAAFVAGQAVLLTAPAWLLAGHVAHHVVRLAGTAMPRLAPGGRPGILARLLARVLALLTALIVAIMTLSLAWEVMRVRPILRALTIDSWSNFSVHVRPLGSDSTFAILGVTLLVMTLVAVTRARPAETLGAARGVAAQAVLR